MNNIGLRKEEIENIAKKHNITDEEVINFITDVVNTNNSIIEDYLRRDYLDTVNNDFEQRARRRR